MTLKTTLLAAGFAAIVGTGAAFAQPYGYAPPPSQAAPYGHQHHHFGVLALIRDEVRAGRIGRKEGMLLEEKIKTMHAERRAERQARYQGMQGGRGYGPGNEQGNYPPPPSQQQPQ